MKHCPITYLEIPDNHSYSTKGLKLLSPQLLNLATLQLSAEDQRAESIARAGKMSLQGVQAKLSAILKIKEGRFEIVDHGGRYILKPQNEYYPELPENEAITMTLAQTLDLEIPVHGLIYSKDGSMTYFIKRFDRIGRHEKLPVEDFAQLSQHSRETKYNSSMEKLAKIIQTFCTFPRIESIKLFKLTLFNFLIGNEDMHLKNFSLITRSEVVTLSPCYDLLNTTIAQKNPQEEIALPLHGKKNKLTKSDFIDYFGINQLQLNENIIAEILDDLVKKIPDWNQKIQNSFLSPTMKEKYLILLANRSHRLGLDRIHFAL